ncbi:hypothetical protein Taro_031766 [Colocasia esculenta]|uniref:Uncharacterized protein n=1 Tax=Colocasia esculenta TaxID=4460 RepID=A0A843VJM4_COLES|nr:hypothetical protein [Colocasia esculenta]
MVDVMAPSHSADVPMEDASVQGEHTVEKEAEIQGAHTASAPADMFQEGVVESPSDEDVDIVEPAVRAHGKGKGVTQISLLTRRAHHSSKKKKLRVNMKPVINWLDAHGEILCSLQNEVSSTFVSQSTGAKQIGAMKAELQSLKEEEVRPSGPVGAEDAGPSRPKVVEGQPAPAASGPSGPSVEQPGPPGSVVDEQSGPSGPVESQDEQGRVEAPVEEVVPPEPPSSPLQTPAPPSPPSSTIAPLAPATFKQPLPKHISSPTPFPTTTSSSPASSTFILSPPSEAPPASSSSTRASSSGPSSSGPSIPPPTTAYSFLHPPTPPSFITIILEGAQLEGSFIQDIKDEFERLSPSDWERLYPLTAQQLLDLNASQARSNQPPLSAVKFLDLNSIHLVRDPFDMWVERYKVYISMKKELKHQQIFYPISIDQFLQHANFGTSNTYKTSLGKDKYGNFLEAQRQLHIQRMAPVMGPSYSIVYGAFHGYFEEQECKTWLIITRYASLLSPTFYIPVPPQ